MKREITFRGRYKSTNEYVKIDNDGEWVYGDLVQKAIFYCGSFIDAIFTDNGVTVPIDPHTVGQFSGLKDKNGQPVYEGDVVCKRDLTFGLKWLGFVVYNEQIGCFRIHNEIQGVTVDTGFENSDTYNDGKCTVECKYEYEVLGNIFDNKELLNDGQK